MWDLVGCDNLPPTQIFGFLVKVHIPPSPQSHMGWLLMPFVMTQGNPNSHMGFYSKKNSQGYKWGSVE